jgi:hypothetical protein
MTASAASTESMQLPFEHGFAGLGRCAGLFQSSLAARPKRISPHAWKVPLQSCSDSLSRLYGKTLDASRDKFRPALQKARLG